jgi:threonyl-tRNA synthetase
MLILGEKEQTQGVVSVRKHKEGDKGSVKLSELISELKNKIENKLNNN